MSTWPKMPNSICGSKGSMSSEGQEQEKMSWTQILLFKTHSSLPDLLEDEIELVDTKQSVV